MALGKKLLSLGLVGYLALNPVLAKDNIYYKIIGKTFYVYVRNAKTNCQKSNNSSEYSNEDLEDRIRNAKINYFSDDALPPDDYFITLHAWKYFDKEKANKIANRMVKEHKLKPHHKSLFVRACQKWPFINFYSNKRNIDPRLIFWVAATENAFRFEKGAAGEIGDMQIMPSNARRYTKEWKKDPYWIDGCGIEHPINNYIGGIRMLAGCVKNAGVGGKIRDNNARDIIAIYSHYSRGTDHFHPDDVAYRNFAYSSSYLYIIPLVHQTSAKGNLITAAGKRKLQQKYFYTFGKNYSQEKVD